MTPAPRRETVAAVFGLALACAAGGFSACVDSASPKGIASISLITFASPAVVLGDILRDSTGAAAPAQVIARDSRGDPVEGAVTFLALDSTLSIDADGTVRGLLRDSVGGRIVATAGSLQTPVAKLLVTIRPTTLVATDVSPTVPVTFAISTTLADSLVTSGSLGVKVTGAGGKAAQGIVVTYEIVSAPASSVAGLPTALLINDAGRASTRDTTLLTGAASRKVTFFYRRAAAGLLDGSVTDTIRVRVRALDLGIDLVGSPFEFKIPVRRQ